MEEVEAEFVHKNASERDLAFINALREMFALHLGGLDGLNAVALLGWTCGYALKENVPVDEMMLGTLAFLKNFAYGMGNDATVSAEIREIDPEDNPEASKLN